MYLEHPCFKNLPPETKIWRYIDFAKFCDLLERKALYFNPLDKFRDPWEGVYPVRHFSVSEMKEQLHMQGIQESATIARQSVDASKKIVSKRNEFAVNCWHINEIESEGLWRSYEQSGRGVAIQSTFGRLTEGLIEAKYNIYVGAVSYLDYETDLIPLTNIFWPTVHKRDSFQHERELRAVIWSRETPQNIKSYVHPDISHGIYASVDVDKLIESVLIDPTASDWLLDLARSVTSRYRFSFSCKKSSLLEPPDILQT